LSSQSLLFREYHSYKPNPRGIQWTKSQSQSLLFREYCFYSSNGSRRTAKPSSLNPFSSGNTIPTGNRKPRSNQGTNVSIPSLQGIPFLLSSRAIVSLCSSFCLNPFSSQGIPFLLKDQSPIQCYLTKSQSLLFREYHSY